VTLRVCWLDVSVDWSNLQPLGKVSVQVGLDGYPDRKVRVRLLLDSVRRLLCFDYLTCKCTTSDRTFNSPLAYKSLPIRTSASNSTSILHHRKILTSYSFPQQKPSTSTPSYVCSAKQLVQYLPISPSSPHIPFTTTPSPPHFIPKLIKHTICPQPLHTSTHLPNQPLQPLAKPSSRTPILILQNQVRIIIAP